MKVNDPKAWETHTETLEKLVEELDKKLFDIKPEIVTISTKFQRPRAE